MRNSSIEDSEVVPVIESSLFDLRPESDFAVLNLGHGLAEGCVGKDVVKAYGCLRKKVYVDQMEFLPEESAKDGMEFDEDDERSQHFVVLQPKAIGSVAVIACLRVIHRENKPLPIETFFPGVLGVTPPQDSAEISRFISRGPRRQRGEVTKMLFDAVLAHTTFNKLDPVVATIERVPARLIALAGAPNEVPPGGEPRMLEAYGGTINQGVRIKTEVMREEMKKRPGKPALEEAHITGGGVLFWGQTSGDKLPYGSEVAV